MDNSSKFYSLVLVLLLCINVTKGEEEMILECDPRYQGTRIRLTRLVRAIIPDITVNTTSRKGDNGMIGIVGLSSEYTGSAYLAVNSALQVGADMVTVFSTKDGADNIQLYGPDVVAEPYIEKQEYEDWLKFRKKLKKVFRDEMDMLIIGPGLSKNDENTTVIVGRLIKVARKLKKPLILSSTAIDIVMNDPSVIHEYPPPGVLLVANNIEIRKLKSHMEQLKMLGKWKSFGFGISYFVTGRTDYFFSGNDLYRFGRFENGTNRRVAGQGDFLIGALATFWTWALRSELCGDFTTQLYTAAFAAHQFTRLCNEGAGHKYGRSFTAFDMLDPMDCFFRDFYEREDWMGPDPFEFDRDDYINRGDQG